jgi:hypothetical protein
VASYSGLPEPMLARSGRLPTSGDFAYEVKWDGFRAIVSTEGTLRVRSRRGWDMAPYVSVCPSRVTYRGPSETCLARGAGVGSASGVQRGR